MAKYKNPTAGDVLIHEESAIVCRDSIVLVNPTAAEYTAYPGLPVTADGSIALATEEATTTGILLESVLLPASGSVTLDSGVLARGPAVVNENKIATVDPAGTDYTVATIVTAIEALGITVRQEPGVSSVQTN